MPTAPSSEPESPPPQRPERRVLARAVRVWWVQRLLEAARRRRQRMEAPAGENEVGQTGIAPP
jgi:hypothetical protein